jgi:hypothetical protein
LHCQRIIKNVDARLTSRDEEEDDDGKVAAAALESVVQFSIFGEAKERERGRRKTLIIEPDFAVHRWANHLRD